MGKGMSWVSDTQGKQPAGTSEKMLIFWEQTESVSTSSPCCSCESNEKHHSQKEKLPVSVKCLQLLIGHLFSSAAALIGKWWLSPGRLPLFTLCDLTPTSMKVTLTDAEQKLSTWKRHGCFHWPLQSPVKLERSQGDNEKEPARQSTIQTTLFVY